MTIIVESHNRDFDAQTVYDKLQHPSIIDVFPGSSAKSIKTTIDGYNYHIMFKSNQGTPDAITTQQQEEASLWIIKQAFNNTDFKTVDCIKSYHSVNELYSIYPTINNTWLNSILKQYTAIKDQFGECHFTTFNRVGGFMQFITTLVARFEVNKNNWNPADIWLINENCITIDEVQSTLQSCTTIEDVNAILRKLYVDKHLVGISLKLVSGQQAVYEDCNISNTVYNTHQWTIKSIDLKLDIYKIAPSYKPKMYSTQDTVIRMNTYSTLGDCKIQIKQNDSTKRTNLKYEPSSYKCSQSRGGKASVRYVESLISQYNISSTFKNDHNLYPSTYQELIDNKHYNLKDAYKDVKNIYEFGINNNIEIDMGYGSDLPSLYKIREYFKVMYGYYIDESGKHDKNNKNIVDCQHSYVAISKLMQIHFTSTLVSIGDVNKVNMVLSEIILDGLKIGERYGPYGKLY